MRARDVVGRKITEVRQTRYWDQGRGRFVMVIDALHLDDGTVIFFHANNDDVEPYPVADVGWRK